MNEFGFSRLIRLVRAENVVRQLRSIGIKCVKAAETKAKKQAWSEYGYCPECNGPVMKRSRGGDDAKDTCINGHCYPAGQTLEKKNIPKGNDSIAVAKVLRGSHLQSVGNWILSELGKRMTQIQAEIISEIKKTSPVNLDDLQVLQADVDKRITNGFDQLRQTSVEKLHDLVTILTDKNADDLADHHGIESKPVMESNRIISAPVLGMPLEDHFEKMASDMVFRVNAALRTGFDAGDNAEELIKRVFGDDGLVKADYFDERQAKLATANKLRAAINLTDTSVSSLERVIQAAITAFASEAEDHVMGSAETEKNIGWQWTAVNDTRVCPYCAGMDGHQYTMDDEPVGKSPEIDINIPAHFGCRCAKIPVDLDAPAAKGANEKSFEDYLSEFSTKEQYAAFGEQSVRAYRRGEITPAQLTQKNSNLLTLENFKNL